MKFPRTPYPSTHPLSSSRIWKSGGRASLPLGPYVAVEVKKSKEAQKTLNWGLFLYPSDPRMHMDYATILELHGQKIVSDQNANYDPAIVPRASRQDLLKREAALSIKPARAIS